MLHATDKESQEVSTDTKRRSFPIYTEMPMFQRGCERKKFQTIKAISRMK